MSKFKVGDVVKLLYNVPHTNYRVGDKEVVSKINLYNEELQLGYSCWVSYRSVEKCLEKEDNMSKYEELRERIRALDNGWTKEADDILQEILNGYAEADTYYIQIFTHSKDYINKYNPKLMGTIEIQDIHQNSLFFKDYGSQCEKNLAFKKALLWLLNHSKLKNERREELDSLRKEVERLNKRINELEEQ